MSELLYSECKVKYWQKYPQAIPSSKYICIFENIKQRNCYFDSEICLSRSVFLHVKDTFLDE